MSLEENKAIVRKMVEAFNKKDLAVIDEFVDQLLMFPTSGVHDDLVDALSYIDQIATTTYFTDDDNEDYEPIDIVSGY